MPPSSTIFLSPLSLTFARSLTTALPTRFFSRLRPPHLALKHQHQNQLQHQQHHQLGHRFQPFSLPVRTMSSSSTSISAMGKRLEGKTVLVTGASSGIGRSIAQEFARTSPHNLKIIITARRIDTLKEVAAAITQEVGDGVKVLPVKLDVSNPQEVANLIPSLPTEFRDIDILVNNAGLVKGVDQAPNIKEEDMNVMFATNVTGLINLTQAVLPIFKNKRNGEDGGRGDIINIGSIAGREGYVGGSIYCATKAAVRTFTDALRKELIATRIRVIEVDPGQVQTVSTTPTTRGIYPGGRILYLTQPLTASFTL